MPPRPTNIDEFRGLIKADFVRACQTLYWLRPRSETDPETGEERTQNDADGGLIKFQLWPEQRKTAAVMLKQQREHKPVRVVKVKPRQSGDSTYGVCWDFHQVYWGRGQHALILAHHDSTTASLYQMAQTLFAELPPELQINPRKLNRKELAWDKPYYNSIMAQTAGFMDIGHGLTIRHAHISEIDLYADPDTVLEGVMETIAMAAGTSIYIESKAQGVDGWLYHFWNASKRGETGFVPLFTAWYQVPEYRMPVPKDFQPSDEEQEWIAEFKVAPAQLTWYRAKRALMIAKEPWGGDRRMKSSYPFTDLEAFQSSGYCVFPDVVLERLRGGLEPPKTAHRLEHLPQPGQIREIQTDIDPRLPQLWTWKGPEDGRFYALGVDISDGVGQTESVVSVCAYPEYEQVAEWFSSRSSVEETAYVARWLAEKYGGGNCVVIPEINRNGSLILYLLFNLPGNYSVFRWRYLDRPGMEVNENPKLGWETNTNTKKALVQVANMVLMRGEGTVRSAVLHEQMTRCIDVLPGRAWTAAGGRSDRVIAFLIAMMACYLDFEQGVVGNIASERKPVTESRKIENYRDPSTYDAGVDEVFAGHGTPIGSGFDRGDTEDR